MNLQLRHVLTSAVILGLFGLSGTVLVATTAKLTANTIAQNTLAERLKLLGEVMPSERCDNDVVAERQALTPGKINAQAATLYLCRQQGEIVAAAIESTASNGYSGPIRVLSGVLADGKVHGVRILEHKETPGLGDKVELRKSDWVLSFTGQTLTPNNIERWAVKRDGGQFDQFTGATITPRAVTQAVRESLQYFNSQFLAEATPDE